MKRPIISRLPLISYFQRSWVSLGWRHYALFSEIIALCVTTTVGALVLSYAVFQWQDWSSDRADLLRDQLGDGRSLAVAAGLAVERHDGRAATQAHDIFENDDQALVASYVSLSGKRLDLTRPGRREVRLTPSGEAQSVFGARGLEIHLPATLDGHRVGELVMLVSEADVEHSLRRDQSDRGRLEPGDPAGRGRHGQHDYRPGALRGG